MEKPIDFRPSPIAGQWYSSNSRILAKNVDHFIEAAAQPDIVDEIIGIISPHAGHIYSGPVAGYAFATIVGITPDLVAVISPMHQPYMEPLLTSGHDAYQTPLGSIPIAKAAIQDLDFQLKSKLGYGTTPIRNDREHSLEIELPFLQRSLKSDFSLMPVMVREQSFRVAKSLGLSLAKVLENQKSLLVASTDLSHFYSQEQAEKYDNEMLRRIESFDPEAVLKAEDEKAGFACGRGAVAAVIWAARELGGDKVQILNYATSGDISGDYHQVVGYGAAIITKSKG